MRPVSSTLYVKKMDQKADYFAPSTDGEKKWAKVTRTKRYIAIVLLLSYVPIIAIVHTITKSDNISQTLGISFFVVLVISLISVGGKCPRCKNNFFRTSMFRNFFTNKCLHCGMSIKD